MKNRLRDSVADYRYEHALFTADTAKEIACRFDLDEEKAYIAGLLHDCAKGFDDEMQPILALAKEAKLSLSPVQLAEPMAMLHAPLSAYVAQRDYGIQDQEILNAISRHVSGAVGMTGLDKAIYMADLTEPSRKHVDEYREMLLSDLDDAYFHAFTDNIVRFIRNGWLLDDDLSRVYNDLLFERQASTSG